MIADRRPPRALRRLAVIAIAGALALAACGGGDGDGGATGVPSSTAPATPATAGSSTDPTSAPAPSGTDSSSPTLTSGATVSTVPASGSEPIAVPAALDFTAPLVGGGEIEMGASAGRPVLLWFWAPW